MDFKMLVQQALRAMRGRRSSEGVSQKLGYSYNQVHRWESGKVSIGWSEFAEFAEACGINFQVAINRIAILYKIKNAHEASEIIQALFGDYSINEAAKRLGVSRFKVSRWVDGKVEPRAAEMLQVIQFFSGVLIDLYEGLGVVEKVPEMLSRRKQLQALEKIFLTYPYAACFLWAFLLKEYKESKTHIRGFAAKRLKIPQSAEDALLKKLTEVEILGLEKGKYVPHMKKMNTSTLSRAAQREIRKYWLRHGLRFLEEHGEMPDRSRFLSGYLEFSIPTKLIPRVMERYMAFYREISTLAHLDQSGPPEEIRVLSLQIFDPSF